MIVQACFCILFASDVELLRIEKELGEALKARDLERLCRGLEECGRENTLDSLEVLLKYYGPTEELTEGEDVTVEDHFRLFTVAARAIGSITDREAVVALPKLFAREKHWGARLILLAGARLNERIDAVGMSLDALKYEKHPVVLREAVKILGLSKERKAVLPLVEFWERLETKLGPSRATPRPPKGKAAKSPSYRSPEWDRVPLALQEALTRLCGKVLANATQYRRLYEHHGGEIDPTKPVDIEEKGRTVIFGLDLVGKNIAFVLDVSGSMETTDPLPAALTPGPRTSPKKSPVDLLADTERMRIHRAKEELKRVVKGLPEDKSFNVIAFASDVKPWLDHLVPATGGNKKKAIDFIGDMRAEGITVTDLALEYAFQDPIVDTIYLITDGAPTHRGSFGPGLPEDAPRLIEEIVKRAKVLNFRRGVRIFTLGFPGAEESFLKRLSDEHGGTYRPIK